MQRHPQPDALGSLVLLVMRTQIHRQRWRQRFCQQALRYLSRNQGEQAIAAIFVKTVLPRDPGTAERVPHRTVQPSANSHLVRIGPAMIPEALDINDDNGPVNG
jgi:hypothetical protein